MAVSNLHSACIVWTPSTPLSKLGPTYIWAQPLLSEITINRADDMLRQVGTPLLRQLMNLPPLRGAIFTGAPGNGRHTTAAALARSVGKDYIHVRVLGAAIDYESAEDALSVIASVAKAAAESKGLCLLLDNPQHCRHSMMIQSRLLRVLEARNLPLFVIIVADSPADVLPGLQQLLLMCPCPKPSADQRKDWLIDKMKHPIPIQVTKTPPRVLAAQANQFSWKQMNQLLCSMYQLLFWKIFNTVTKDPTKILATLSEGGVPLTMEELTPLIQAIRTQSAAVPATAAPVVVPAAEAAAQPIAQPASVASLLGTVEKSFDKKEAQDFIAEHSNTENMNASQLFNIPGLKI